MMRPVKLKEAFEKLEAGWFIRFIWGPCAAGQLTHTIVSPDGPELLLGGHAYHALIHTHQHKMIRTETGSTDAGDLVIEWRWRQQG